MTRTSTTFSACEQVYQRYRSIKPCRGESRCELEVAGHAQKKPDAADEQECLFQAYYTALKGDCRPPRCGVKYRWGGQQGQIPAGPGYQTMFAERIRKESGIATGAVGFIRSAFQADHILRTEQADVVILARELLRDPYWPLHAARELHAQVAWPPQYERAQD